MNPEGIEKIVFSDNTFQIDTVSINLVIIYGKF